MTRVLQHDSRDSNIETCEGSKINPIDEVASSERLRDVTVSFPDTFPDSHANAFYKVLFQERNNLKSFFTMYDSMESLLCSKLDRKQAELSSHEFDKKKFLTRFGMSCTLYLRNAALLP